MLNFIGPIENQGLILHNLVSTNKILNKANSSLDPINNLFCPLKHYQFLWTSYMISLEFQARSHLSEYLLFISWRKTRESGSMEIFSSYLSIIFLDSPFLHTSSYKKEINPCWKHTLDTDAAEHKYYFLSYNIRADIQLTFKLGKNYNLTLICEALYI